jgi:hypothetical protein
VDLVQPAIWFINPMPGVVPGISKVGIVFEKFGINYPVRKCASYREGIAGYRPLRFSKKAKYLSQVMNKSGQDKPVRVAISPYGFGSLQQVLGLVQVDIRIGIIHQGIEKFHRFPEFHPFFVKRLVLMFHFQHEIIRLIMMVQPVEFPYRIPLRVIIVAVILFGFASFRITCQKVFLPKILCFYEFLLTIHSINLPFTIDN